jgi:hypothetical protein
VLFVAVAVQPGLEFVEVLLKIGDLRDEGFLP